MYDHISALKPNFLNEFQATQCLDLNLRNIIPGVRAISTRILIHESFENITILMYISFDISN